MLTLYKMKHQIGFRTGLLYLHANILDQAVGLSFPEVARLSLEESPLFDATVSLLEDGEVTHSYHTSDNKPCPYTDASEMQGRFHTYIKHMLMLGITRLIETTQQAE